MAKVWLQGHQGLRLAGELHEPVSSKENSPVLIICHGFRGNKEGGGRAVSTAEKAAGLGMTVLRFDFSGTGESEGDFAEASLSTYVQDLAGAVDFAGTLTGGKITLLGRSFGGTAALCLASRDRRIAAVCTWAAPVDLRKTFIVPAGPLLEKSGEVLEIPEGNGSYRLNRAFFDDLLKYNIVEKAACLSPRPFLVVHGTSDETVAFEQGERLYNAAMEPKGFLPIEGGDHRFSRHYDYVEDETLRWFQTLNPGLY